MGDETWPSYGTDEHKNYRFMTLCGKTLRFQVKAAHDVHICFSSKEEVQAPMIEVFLGAWEGTASAIRHNQGGSTDDLCKVESPDLLSEDEFREFWITTDHDQIQVGKGGEYEPFMSVPNPEPFPINYFGYTTGYGATGWFRFHRDRHHESDDSLTYTWEPVYGNTYTFRVACSNDAHIALTTAPEEGEPMVEIFIGGWENQHSAIRFNKAPNPGDDMAKVETPDVLCGDNKRSFWVSFREGHIKVGNCGSEEPFMEWQNEDAFKVTQVGFCTGWGANGKWQLEI